MKIIAQATKEAIIKKVLSQPGVNLNEIAKQSNVSRSGLTKWLREYKLGTLGRSRTCGDTKKIPSRAERLQHILSTASLNEHEIGVYCRERGLYALQLTEWKNEMITEDNGQKQQKLLEEIKLLRDENKRLKQAIQRKDRAFAETAALLVLKKKGDAIWGEYEED
jgi:transposase